MKRTRSVSQQDSVDRQATEDGFTASQWDVFAKRFVSPFVNRSISSEDIALDARTANAMTAHQDGMRNSIAKKFNDPRRWLWTRLLLEQASEERIANLVASSFASGSHIFDICCGGGSDSVELARRGNVVAVDRSQIACSIARANLALNRDRSPQLIGSQTEVRCCDAADVQIESTDWLHIDPDRRVLRSGSTSHSRSRTVDANRFNPSIVEVLSLVRSAAGASVKVAPATPSLDELLADESLSFESKNLFGTSTADCGRQFISTLNSVKQQRWWFRCSDYPPRSITVSSYRASHGWIHWRVANEPSPFVPQGRSDSIVNEVAQNIEGCLIGDADPAVRAAGLQLQLADAIGCRLIGSPQGYFLSTELSSVAATTTNNSYDLIDWFAIEAILPADRKQLKQYCRIHGIGVLEIKVRNSSIRPEELRKQLSLHGENSRVLLITQLRNRTIAFVARRVDTSRS